MWRRKWFSRFAWLAFQMGYSGTARARGTGLWNISEKDTNQTTLAPLIDGGVSERRAGPKGSAFFLWMLGVA